MCQSLLVRASGSELRAESHCQSLLVPACPGVPAGLRTAIAAFPGTTGPLSSPGAPARSHGIWFLQLLRLERARITYKDILNLVILD